MDVRLGWEQSSEGKEVERAIPLIDWTGETEEMADVIYDLYDGRVMFSPNVDHFTTADGVFDMLEAMQDMVWTRHDVLNPFWFPE
jgi:hypothetical protein